MSDDRDSQLLAAIYEIALEAGEKILEIYRKPIAVDRKDDKSPVTEADVAGEKIILAGLARLTPEIPVIAEESVAAGRIPEVDGRDFWLVDPLDGTKEFISKNGEFTVNIALVRRGRPVLGVIHVPAKAMSYGGAGAGTAWRRPLGGAAEPITVRNPDDAGLIAVASRSHRSPETDAFLEDYKVASIASAGSSLKFCLVAEGSADIYPRLGRTMEWDIGAGVAILEAAGGRVTKTDGSALAFGKPGFDNPHFVAWGNVTPA
ncbi:3'(2'),5'-bisphosphate nucleotidase CysQ [Oceanibacterium hippocampi]|uniref:3'(2'),5'-bisphosphate nucleotidase CysQ n=1 Tax=Oceanibacterium hippocampi TaxID=745714 RepID=A0A1Y5TW02_9PROT|nr:3'(2'),5'-bisphosphate nucleotidase CysQ [Oceanibacterium hippocampi]SLN69745.1 3'(2'),5'-bisphosphate nucleotidase CysQ [Oceanibacterium hippocampi]